MIGQQPLGAKRLADTYKSRMNVVAGILLAFAGTFGIALQADAQAWPAKPIHFVVAFAPGGPADIVARIVGQKLTEYLGQQIVVENRGGAGGNIGATAVAKSAADGYTVLVTTTAFAVNATLFSNPGYDAERDFIPVMAVASQPNLIVVNANVAAKTLSEYLAQVKGKKIVFASPGSGTAPHLTGENLLRVLAKLDATAVHFRGAGPAVAAVVAGEPEIGSMAVASPLPYLKSGRLRALGVSSAKRLAILPDVPTFVELGYPGVQDYTWIGVFLAAGTPAAIVNRLNEALNRAAQSPDVRERLETQALDPVGGTPREFAEYVKAEIAKWGRIVQETGSKPD
jgi:tripartite-type tricarboxylate transporter receptor subunit TctC